MANGFSPTLDVIPTRPQVGVVARGQSVTVAEEAAASPSPALNEGMICANAVESARMQAAGAGGGGGGGDEHDGDDACGPPSGGPSRGFNTPGPSGPAMMTCPSMAPMRMNVVVYRPFGVW